MDRGQKRGRTEKEKEEAIGLNKIKTERHRIGRPNNPDSDLYFRARNKIIISCINSRYTIFKTYLM